VSFRGRIISLGRVSLISLTRSLKESIRKFNSPCPGVPTMDSKTNSGDVP
jgi:hypothetical protein